MRRFSAGFALPAAALDLLLSRRGLKRYAVLPLLANVVVYALVIALVLWLASRWDPTIGPWEFWGPVGGWLSAALDWSAGALKWLVLLPLLAVGSWFTFIAVGMTIAGPFNDMLSERIERAICRPKEDLALPLRLTVANALLSIVDSLRILGRQALWTLLALPFLAVPLVGFVPLLLVTAWFTGLGYFDASMARNDLRHRHRAPMFREAFWELLGLGLAMELLFLIPLVGLVMLPIGVTAGTILYCRLDWEEYFARRGIEAPAGFRPPHVAASFSDAASAPAPPPRDARP